MIAEVYLHESEATCNEGVILMIEDTCGGLVVEVAIVADAH